MSHLLKLLKAHMKANNLTPVKLCKLLKGVVSVNTVYKTLEGRKPSSKTFRALTGLLELSEASVAVWQDAWKSDGNKIKIVKVQKAKGHKLTRQETLLIQRYRKMPASGRKHLLALLSVVGSVSGSKCLPI